MELKDYQYTNVVMLDHPGLIPLPGDETGRERCIVGPQATELPF